MQSTGASNEAIREELLALLQPHDYANEVASLLGVDIVGRRVHGARS